MTSNIEIEAQDVIRLIEQFLKENNLQRTLQTLQEESLVHLNTVDNVEVFREDILQGRWDNVLKAVKHLILPQRKLMELYEQCVLELIEMGEKAAAKVLLRQTTPMQHLKDTQPDRYLHLESMLTTIEFHPRIAYGSTSKLQRREKLAQSIGDELTVVPPSRLLTLLGQALQWQTHQDGPLLSGYNLFRGEYPLLKPEPDSIPTHCFAKLVLPSPCQTCLFSPNGHYLITGAANGMIEMLHPLTGKLHTEFKYQDQDDPFKRMRMDAPILSLAMTRDAKYLASGSETGVIQIWQPSTGSCVFTFPQAHAQGVTCLSWHKDGSQLLSGGYDGLLRLHGMKAGRLLKEFRGHSSFVNSITYVSDYTRIFSGSSDGSVRIWDSKTGACLKTLIPANQASILFVQLIPSRGHLLITSQSTSVVLMDAQGSIVWTLPTRLTKDLIWSALSPHGEYAYLLTEDGTLTHVHFESGTMTSMHAGDKLMGIASHPLANLVCVWSELGELVLWRS